MTLVDLPYGFIQVVEVFVDAADQQPEFAVKSEVELVSLSGDRGIYVIQGGAASRLLGPLKCESESQMRKLQDLLAQKWPRLCCLVDRDGNRSFIRIHTFLARYQWSDEMAIGVTDKILGDIRRRHFRRNTPTEEIVNWLDEQLLLPVVTAKAAGSSSTLVKRAFLSAGNPSADSPANTFRLCGPELAADVAPDSEGKLKIERVTRHLRTDLGRVNLVEAPVRFCDASVAGAFKGVFRSQLDDIVARAGSYLELWRQYNELEKKVLLERARNVGFFAYHSLDLAGGDDDAETDLVFRIQDPKAEALENLREAANSQPLFLEAASELPEYLEPGAEDPAEPKPASGGKKKAAKPEAERNLIGRCHPDEVTSSSIRLIELPEDAPHPPKSGYLFLSTRGNEASLKRRDLAEEKIRSSQCPMRQLGLIIENQPVPVAGYQRVAPLTPAVLKKFHASPTRRQEEAIEIAVNTPDIAVIQGPPGTGKTQVISGIVKRLEELANPDDMSTGTFLLTSFQHDAVENVMKRISTYGLPPLKLGLSRRQKQQGIKRMQLLEEWSKKFGAYIRERRERCPGYERVDRFRELQTLLNSYLGGYHNPEETARCLNQAAELSESIAPGSVRDSLRRKALEIAEFNQSQSGGTERDDLLKAIRALRYQSESFQDDGPIQAMRLRQWVDRGKLTISSEERTLLATAATWVKSSPPPGKFLEELAGLRDQLLQKCAPDKRPLRIREKARADVSALLSEAVGAANRQLRESDEGLALILDDYLRDLEGDPQRVLDALRTYSVVAAETCQGSGRLSAAANSPSGSEGFETVIVDEAARANPLDLFIPMAQARRRIILVGDHRQLPQILDPALEKELKASQSEDTERYISTSLFEKLFKEMRVREKQDLIPRTITLDTQFRMGSKLGRFVSEQFYEKHDEPQLLTGIIDEDKLRHGIGRFTKNGEECVAAWIDVPGDQGFEESGASRRRQVEARRIIRELKLLCEESPDLSVGVISFYSAQVALISKLLETSEFARRHPEWRNHKLQIGTVDSFQGLEFDVVILSMTRSNRPWQSPRANEPLSVEELELLIRRRYGFLCLENRACVALSRQKRLLIVIGDSRMVDCPEAEKVIPALAAFYKLCRREPYGIYL